MDVRIHLMPQVLCFREDNRFNVAWAYFLILVLHIKLHGANACFSSDIGSDIDPVFEPCCNFNIQDHLRGFFGALCRLGTSSVKKNASR